MSASSSFVTILVSASSSFAIILMSASSSFAIILVSASSSFAIILVSPSSSFAIILVSASSYFTILFSCLLLLLASLLLFPCERCHVWDDTVCTGAPVSAVHIYLDGPCISRRFNHNDRSVATDRLIGPNTKY